MNSIDILIRNIELDKTYKWVDFDVDTKSSEILDCRYAFDQIHQSVRFIWKECAIAGYTLDVDKGEISGLVPTSYTELYVFVLYVALFVYYGTDYSQAGEFCTNLLRYTTLMSDAQVKSLVAEIEMEYGI